MPQLQQLTAVPAFSAALEAHRAAGRTVGLVPTMGALHAGHASLVRRAAAECDVVAVTIFVNPLQFGPGEDFGRYPRSLAADTALAGEAGAGLVFAPGVEDMYPQGVVTSVHVDGLTDVLEGASRPGHFDGVATVVAKLFAMAGRCRAYFGVKDYQQLAVIRRMAADLSFPVDIVGCPTVREPDGLALSSRNAYLSPADRRAAAVLYRALELGASVIGAGELVPPVLSAAMSAFLADQPRVDVDYAVAVDAAHLVAPAAFDPGDEVRLLVAAWLGATRLIDNLGVVVPDPARTTTPSRKADASCAGA